MMKRILVIEEQEDLCGVLRDLLVGSGYEVVEAGDGREGVAKTLAKRPDLMSAAGFAPAHLGGCRCGRCLARSG